MTLLYLDPGTGSFIFQGIAAIAAGIALSYKYVIYFIKKIFSKKNNNSHE